MRVIAVGIVAFASAACFREAPRARVPSTEAGIPVPPSSEMFAPPSVAPAGRVAVPSAPPTQTGLATWYGEALRGHRTASGERFDPGALTGAHRTLPLGTWVVVRLRATGREVALRINDRGPWGDPRRVIDVSRAAADALGLTGLGVSTVDVWVVPPP
jgi:rare lipoprotein A